MKRILVVLGLLVTLAAGTLRAQGRHEINLFIGGADASFVGLRDINQGHKYDLFCLFEPNYRFDCAPTVTLDYHYALLNWLCLGAQVNWSSISGTVYYRMGNRESERFSLNMCSVLPQAKFRIPSPEHFRLYGKVAAGLQANIGALFTSPVQFAWEVVPIGCEWGGQRVYGTAEVCLGNVLLGGRIGIGFRF